MALPRAALLWTGFAGKLWPGTLGPQFHEQIS